MVKKTLEVDPNKILLDEQEAEYLTGLCGKTLRKIGVPIVRLGRRVLYPQRELREDMKRRAEEQAKEVVK